MGAFDDREQKDAAVKMVGELDAEIVALKSQDEGRQSRIRELLLETDRLRAEKDSPHADAKYRRELQEARADLAERSRAFEDAAKVANAEISRRMRIEAERDAALAQVAELQSGLPIVLIDDHEVCETDLVAAFAWIEQVRGHIGQENTDSWHATKIRRVRELLAFVPGDALAEHDRTVLEESDRDWAGYFEGIGSHVGDPEFTQALVVKLLRGPRPFGKAAA